MTTSRLSLIVAGLMLAVTAYAAAPAADFYVSPGGNDRWSGRLDAPFATVPRAQQAVRELRRAGSLNRPVVVILRGGMYYLDRTLVITPDDSGTVFAAYPGEKPVLSGGTELTGWRKDAAGRWQVRLPEVARGEWSFEQLWVNGERRYRPRLPADGYFLIEKPLPPTNGVKDAPPDRFKYPKGAFDPAWPDLADIEVLVFHAWTMDRLRVKSVDAERRAVTFTAPTLSSNWFFDLRGGLRFIVENAGAAFAKPGTWYLDRKAGVLSYLPLPGEDMTKAQVIAPRLDRLVRLVGEVRAGLAVGNVVFRGLTFAHSQWVTPPEGYKCGQSESVLWGAVTADGARNCVFDACTVTHVGVFGIELLSGCVGNVIENCEVTDCAAGGIKIGEMNGRSPAEITSHNIVRNNLLAHLGRMHAAGPGVWIGQSPYNEVVHNEICDLYQLAISVGWTWGYGPSLADHNHIAYNLIHDVGQGVTSDIGGVYTLGTQHGTVIEHNVIHDVSCDMYGGRGLYSDEGSTDIVIRDNIVYHTDAGAFCHHYGKENHVTNNILALARGGQLERVRDEEGHQSFFYEHNIVYYDATGSMLLGNWGNDLYTIDSNLYWEASGKPVLFGDQTLEQWRKRGHDLHSVVADPLFVDPQHGDFTLKPGSPAIALGFKPIDVSQVGRTVAGKRQPETSLVPRAFPEKMAAQPQEIDEDFEDSNVGDASAGAVVNEENNQAVIRVTDEQAAAGKRSLKFTDLPGQKYNYDPHMYWTVGRDQGVVRLHYDVRVEPGFHFYHEWRDTTIWFKSGPVLQILPDGSLQAGGKTVATVPHSVWLGIDIVCGLGRQSTGTWDLTVTVPGKDPLHFADLPYDPGFKSVIWLMFGGHGEEAGVAYLDNVRLH